MTQGYMCSVCHVEHDTIPRAMDCFQSHEVLAAEDPAEHVLEEAVTLEPEAPRYPPKAPELLGRAAAHMHDRASTYDAPEGERSMGKAVTAFNAITGHTLTESEGWLLLQVLKDVRLFTRSAYHADSAEDCIAYAALKAEAKGAGR